MKPKPETRFEILHDEALKANRSISILRDKYTGILYLSNYHYQSGGITPLLDSEGKPIIELNSPANE